ncbi:MAG TPA: hypothetical protein VGH28_19115 [Polyangiaceae bacterium]|jgi:hypothetical protein
MSSPFRDERDAALERAARLERENAQLRERLDEARRPRGPRSKRAWVLVTCAVVLAILGVAAQTLRPKIEAALEARRLARAHEVVRMDWTDESSGTQHTLRAAWSGLRGAYAVGDRGTILFRDTTGAWSRQPSGTTENLRAVDGGSTRDVVGAFATFAVGDHGVILRYDAETRAWVPEASGTTETLRAVTLIHWTAFVAGDHGTLLRRDVGGWTRITTHTTEGLRALYSPDDWGAQGHTLYAVGTHGTILYLDNLFSGIVSAQRSGTDVDLAAIGGYDDTIVAGGAAGTLLVGSRDPSVPWTTVDLATTEDIVAVGVARETFERCTDRAECRFLIWTPTVVAASRGGEIAALDPHRGWILHSAQGLPVLAMTALYRIDDPKDELLLLGEDGKIRRGTPAP